MAIPDYQSIMLPLLQLAADQQEHALRETIDALADEFNLTDEDRNELLPSGRQATFQNRVGWARTYLKKAGLLQSTRRGYYQITERGLSVLVDEPTAINAKFLKQFPEFQEFQSISKKAIRDDETDDGESKQTPEESLEQAVQSLNDSLAADLVQTIKECSPSFFEQLVVDLLVTMGYGGTRKDAGQTVGRSGDGGIDGIIKEPVGGAHAAPEEMAKMLKRHLKKTISEYLTLDPDELVAQRIDKYSKMGHFTTKHITVPEGKK